VSPLSTTRTFSSHQTNCTHNNTCYPLRSALVTLFYLLFPDFVNPWHLIKVEWHAVCLSSLALSFSRLFPSSSVLWNIAAFPFVIKTEWCSAVWTAHLSTHLGCFHFLAVTSNAAMNTVIHVFDWVQFSVCSGVYILRSGISGSYGSSAFNLCLAQWLHHCVIHQQCITCGIFFCFLLL
jgi:hypothetical protein